MTWYRGPYTVLTPEEARRVGELIGKQAVPLSAVDEKIREKVGAQERADPRFREPHR